MKTLIKQDFFTDGGHGWLKVSKSRLEKLGIIDKITSCSFMRGQSVYLEEDCDVSTYVKALLEKEGIVNSTEGYTIFMKQFWANTTTTDSSNNMNGSKIRSYNNFVNYSDDEKLLLEELQKKMYLCKRWNKTAKNKIKNGSLADLNYWKGEYNF